MATNNTEHYGLCQWEEDDSFLRTDFNGDNEKIDAALTGKAEHSAFLDLEAVVALKGRLTVGVYEGNDAASRVISLGFTPKVVVLTDKGGHTLQANMVGYQYGGIALTGHNAPAVQIVSGGFQVFNDDSRRLTNCLRDGPYGYFALG